MPVRQQTIERLTDYYAAMEANEPSRLASYYADTMTVTFANNPPINGAADFLAVLSQMLGSVRSVRHDLMTVWEQGDDVIFESMATWTLLDGRTLSIPACSVCTMVDGLFTDQRIYVDNAPLFAALEQGAAVRA